MTISLNAFRMTGQSVLSLLFLPSNNARSWIRSMGLKYGCCWENEFKPLIKPVHQDHSLYKVPVFALHNHQRTWPHAPPHVNRNNEQN